MGWGLQRRRIIDSYTVLFQTINIDESFRMKQKLKKAGLSYKVELDRLSHPQLHEKNHVHSLVRILVRRRDVKEAEKAVRHH